MWLIDTTTFELLYQDSPDEVEYVILPHTWEAEEVTFQEMRNLKKARLKKGFAKIAGVCKLAREIEITRAWVDTCCIDKTSSAELTESINSMFQWYKSASVCVAFLHDLQPHSNVKNMAQCKWFTRGWTLQEMVAPAMVEFYDNGWNFRGTKVSLVDIIVRTTKVDAKVLDNPEIIYDIPVGKRMSWTAARVTTRLEDRAYSLLGIFDVNMPLIYGEGEKAFLRLQEAIAREMDDLSLLAWATDAPEENFRGVFAKSPFEFRRLGKMLNIDNPVIETPAFTVTNKGLQIHTSLQIQDEDDYLLNLHCTTNTHPDHVIAIRLVKTPRGFVRDHTNQLYLMDQSQVTYQERVPITILKHIRPSNSDQVKNRLAHSFYFRVENSPPIQTRIFPNCPKHLWDEAQQRFLSGGHELFTCLLELSTKFAPRRYSNLVVLCGLIRAHAGQDQNSDGVVLKESKVEPWAFLLNRHYDSKDLFQMMDDAKGDPFALDNLGHTIRSRLLKGEQDKLPPNKRTFQENWSNWESKSLLRPESVEEVLECEIIVETKFRGALPEHTVTIKLRPLNLHSPWLATEDGA